MKKQWDIFVMLPEKRLTIVLTPKVASTAIIKALLAHYDAKAVRPFHGSSVFSWMTLDQVNTYVPSYRRAMFVRNPFARLVGCYEYNIVQGKLRISQNFRDQGFHVKMTFAQYLDVVLRNTEADPHYAMQSWQSDRVDFLGRLETLAADWDKMRKQFNVSLPNLNVVNGSGRERVWRPYYTATLRKRVEETYAPDLEAYGYQF